MKKSHPRTWPNLFILTFLTMIPISQAQTSEGSQLLQAEVPQKSFGQKLKENTTLSYYHQILGPTVAGRGGETYNVFQESRSPYQSFHAASLRYKVNQNWSFGASISGVNAYGDTITNQQTGISSESKVRDEFFNARFFLSIPSIKFAPGTLFTMISYEAPTSVFARENDMQYGLVLAQSFALNLPSQKWSAGLTWQYYRMFFKQNSIPSQFGFSSFPRQTTIVSGGPYISYLFNDNWGVNTSATFDWDQRGNQTGTGRFNNNLPDRMRLGVSYYPTKIKQIASIGVFTQALIKYTTNTQAIGAEFALKF